MDIPLLEMVCPRNLTVSSQNSHLENLCTSGGLLISEEQYGDVSHDLPDF
jgi:hypothetical protein